MGQQQSHETQHLLAQRLVVRHRNRETKERGKLREKAGNTQSSRSDNLVFLLVFFAVLTFPDLPSTQPSSAGNTADDSRKSKEE